MYSYILDKFKHVFMADNPTTLSIVSFHVFYLFQDELRDEVLYYALFFI